MNYYIVVEGKSGERKVYPKWIQILNPDLTQVYSLADISSNNYYLISGNGYPQYLKIVDRAVEDCAANKAVDRLVIAVDAEDFSYQEKEREVVGRIAERLDPQRVCIVVQYPCFESWALGNRIVFRRKPVDSTLRRYLRFYDVRTNDPESLPALQEESLNKCQFAFVYLKRILNDRYPNLTYTKSNPKVVEHPKYFEQIRRRLHETRHIRSFGPFLDAFRKV
jgi:hypothetical protein